MQHAERNMKLKSRSKSIRNLGDEIALDIKSDDVDTLRKQISQRVKLSAPRIRLTVGEDNNSIVLHNRTKLSEYDLNENSVVLVKDLGNLS
jgi:hypothetical protein